MATLLQPDEWADFPPSLRYSIVPSTQEHCDELAYNMRKADRDEVQAAGLSSYRAVNRAFRNGILSRSAFVDGEIAAMWGLGGTLISNVGTPWLLTTHAAERVPLTFVKVGKSEVERMLMHRSVLENYVTADYEKAIKFLRILGFRVGAPFPFGIRGQMFCKFEMRKYGV